MRSALVFGGSGQIGRPLLVYLHRRGWQVIAVSRREQPAMPGVRWLRGDLQAVAGLPPRVAALFRCGQIEHFARWFAQSLVESPRVVASGSPRLASKQEPA